jgi:hypothetical protein
MNGLHCIMSQKIVLFSNKVFVYIGIPLKEILFLFTGIK